MCKLFQKYARKITTIIIVLLFCLSLWQLGSASWIQGKAMVAQQLLNVSWNATLNDRKDNTEIKHKPWPWADTWPVAKLTVPQYNIEQIVLAGDSGNSLAFAPGYSFASAAPNTSGTTVISGHRDTHFAFLKKLNINDVLFIETAEKINAYRIYDFKIVDSRSFNIDDTHAEQTLLLVTCYPFETLVPGGPLRYLVYAKKHPAKDALNEMAI